MIDRQEIPEPLPILPPGPFISVGRVLDYEHWEDCDRFLELDRLIADRGRLRKLAVAARNRRVLAMLAAGHEMAATALAEDISYTLVRQIRCRALRKLKAA